MSVLVADVGGTNTRIAVVGADLAVQGMSRFENDAYPSFYAVLAEFLKRNKLPELKGCCVAVAGPVTAQYAQLTNRDWLFDACDIASMLPAPGPMPVQMVNDLAALGHSLPLLMETQFALIKPAGTGARINGQSVVAGLGTGFNVCMVKSATPTPIVLEAELGHASLPASVQNRLQKAIGESAAQFNSVESLFSGRGLSQLFAEQTGGEWLSGPDILTAYNTSGSAQNAQTVELFASLLGDMARELVFQYQPFEGINFAGGVARGLLASRARASFLDAFGAHGHFSDHIACVPVRVILDDAAALNGAALLARRAAVSDQ